MSSSGVLFACSKCFSRHPFEELSTGHLCKECRGAFPVVKCTYCRSEFQQTTKTTSVCGKCELNCESYGKPSPCEYCNIIAAFIGNKCQRCTNSEKKYGPPVTCQQCKQKCAFDRHDQKVEGKLLCWLCTLSYKRAVAKSTTERHFKKSKHKLKDLKRLERLDVTKEKRKDEQPTHNNSMATTPDHVVALTTLKESVSNLKRELNSRDQMLLQKDRQITELRANNFTTENELRSRLKEVQRDFEQKIQTLHSKLKETQKELARSKNKVA